MIRFVGEIEATPDTDDSDMRVFAHGTSLESAENILRSGLEAEAARAASLGERAQRPGAFFTHAIGPPESPGEGFQLAFEWGLRHSPRPVVLVGELPASVFRRLMSRGFVLQEPVPGAEADVPWQTVFLPESFPMVNAHLRWYLVNPFGT